MSADRTLGEMVVNSHTGRTYAVSTMRNPAGLWETAVLENPGIANAIFGRRRLHGRIILVTPILVYQIGGSPTLQHLLRQPVAWVNLHTEKPMWEEAHKVHAFVADVVRNHSAGEWRDLLLRHIETDLADVGPQVIESKTWFAGESMS